MVFAASSALAQPGPAWSELESPLLRDAVQLTFDEDFVKAGEAYFSPDGTMVVFQAVPVPPKGQEPSPHYGMYVARVTFAANGDVVGLERAELLRPPGSASTCGWFHPTETGKVIFGCTLTAPGTADAPGYQRAGSRYAWSFPVEMEVCEAWVPGEGEMMPAVLPRPVFSRPGYDAECSFSSDGRYVLYANVDPAKGDKPDADIWVYDTKTQKHVPLVTAEGYDGGPFFSPDGKKICYRSDRRGDDLLQLFVAELDFAADGSIEGVKREVQITDNQHVNWAPYWDPSGAYLLYTTSEVGHFNYELFAIDVRDLDAAPKDRAIRRVTFAAGFDGLGVFSPDGKRMMWTSQRTVEGSGKGSSQLWVAKYEAGPGAWVGALSGVQAVALVRAELEARRGAEYAMTALLVEVSETDGEWIVEHAGVGGTQRYRVDAAGVVRALGGE